MNNMTFASYTIDKETVEDIQSLPAELQHLAWALLARYGISGEVVSWTTTDSTLAYVSGALSRARQRIDAHRTGTEQTMIPATTQTSQPTAQPTAPTQVIQQAAPVTAPKPTPAQATTPIPTEAVEEANPKTPEEWVALERAMTPAPVHTSEWGGPTLEEVRQYWAEKGFAGTGLRFWVYYEAVHWVCSGSAIRRWRLVANSFGSGEKKTTSAKPAPAKAPAAPAVTQTQTARPVPPANEVYVDLDHPGIFGDDTDDDDDDRITGIPEGYEIDDLLNDNAGTETPENTNPNKMLGCGTAQTGTTPDGHEIKVTPDDDDLPF